jgi:hypothetical protein
MKTSNTAGWVVAALVVIAIVGWAITKATNSLPSLQGDDNASGTPATGTQSGSVSTGTSGTGSSANLGQVYANAAYNFTISFPKSLHTQPFDNFHVLNQNDWHYGATQTFRGTPVISIPVIEVDNQATNKKLYPLFYTAQVRVGVSPDTANCYSLSAGYSSQKVTNVTIGGVAFKKFDFGDAATGQYVRGSEYRTIHANQCFVITQVEHGSSYTDSTLSTQYTDAQLKALYAQTTPIVMSFRFKK